MSEGKPEYTAEQNHEAKRQRVQAIKDVLARYAAGEIGHEQATADIETIAALSKLDPPLKPFEATINWD